jgi:hypothetical protein
MLKEVEEILYMKQIRASGFLLYRKRRLRRLMLTEEELD